MRPEGWNNPYPKTGETVGMWALYEAGADAYEAGLKKDALPIGGYRKLDDGLIKTLPVSSGLPYGYLVFIPGGKE